MAQRGVAMAVKTFVLIEVSVGRIRDIINSLRGIEEVQSASMVTGPYDVIAVVAANDMQEIANLVTGRIQNLRGVTKTITCVAM